jgi:hypothetical protein
LRSSGTNHHGSSEAARSFQKAYGLEVHAKGSGEGGLEQKKRRAKENSAGGACIEQFLQLFMVSALCSVTLIGAPLALLVYRWCLAAGF